MVEYGAKLNRKGGNMSKECRVVTVQKDQLPLCCPLPSDEVWNAHPRVYLPIEAKGEVQCPYCSTRYRLES